MKIIKILCTIFIYSFCSISVAGKLILLTENYPPFNMSIDEKNFARGDSIDGISTDIVKELMSRASIDYSMTLRFPWARVYGLAQSKPNYGLFSTAYLDKRKKDFKWVGPLVGNDYVLFSPSGKKFNINKFSDLKKYRIGSYKGSGVAEVLKEKGISVIESYKDNGNPAKLAKGKIDLWATGEITGRYIASMEGINNLQTVFKVKAIEYYLALNLSTEDTVVNKLQKTLNQMREEGVLDEMKSRYQ